MIESFPMYFGSGVEWNGEVHFVAAGQYNLNRERHGLWKFYFPTGKISTSEVYQNDSLLSIKSFDQNGNPIPNEGVLTRLEIESTYPGGLPGWSRYLLRSLNYPVYAQKNNIEGIVVVEFMLDEEGEPHDAKAVLGPSALRAEAVRVIQKSGAWIPGVYHGVKTKTYKKQPIQFRLQ